MIDQLVRVPYEVQCQDNGILTCVDPEPLAVRKSLITQYGEISREEVQRQALIYIGTNNHRDQDSDMVFNCLKKSITDVVFAKVTTEPEHYMFTIDGEEDEPESIEDGPCFLKAVIDKTYTNMRANSTVARENLANLAEYMEALPDSNIIDFNEYVKKQVETLASGVKQQWIWLLTFSRCKQRQKTTCSATGYESRSWHTLIRPLT